MSDLRALTLLEALLAATILAIAASAAILPFAAGAQQIEEATKIEAATSLAEALMDEIVAHPFEDPGAPGDRTLGPDAGESDRAQFDNIDDYNGYAEADKVIRDEKLQPTTPTGAAGLWRSVRVQYVSLSGQQAWDQNNFALVAVEVFDGSRSLVVLRRLVSREY